MGKLVKVLFIVLGLFVAAVVALAVFLPMYFDPNDYKDEISTAVKDKTGRDLTISGDIGLSVFPWIGADIGATQLSNAQGFGDKPFAEIQEVAVRLKLMPLLQGNIEIGRVSLTGLRLRLAKNAQGKTNWEDLQEVGKKEGATADKPDVAPEKKDGGFEVKSLQVEGVDINDAAIYWSDASTNTSYTLEDLNLETGVIKPGSPFPLALDFVINQQEPPLTTQVNVSTTASVDVEKQAYGLKELVLDLTAIGEGIPGGKQTISLTGDADVNLEAETASLPNLSIQAAGGRLDGAVEASRLLGDPVLKGSLKGDNLSPRDIMKTLGMSVPETADPNVLSKASANVKFNGKLSNLSITPLTVVLDDTNINGSARLSRNSPLVIGFDLNVDAIDLDRYLPPSEKPKPKKDSGAVAKAPPPEGSVAKKGGSSSELNDTEIPVDVLNSLNLDGQLKVKNLKLKGMTMNNVAVLVESKAGVLDIKPLDAALYKGNADIRARVNAAVANPTYALKTNLRSVQSGPLLKDLMGDDRLSGLANIALDVTSKGKTVGAVRQALNGTINVEFLEGQIKGFNLAQMLRAARARLKGEPPPPAEPQVTDFAVLSMSGVINNGVMTSSDLNFKSPFLRVGGEGKVNLVSEVVDYLARVTVVGSSTGQGGEGLDDLKGLTIPIRLKGPMTAPGWKIELDDVFKEQAKARLEAEKAEARAKLEAQQEAAKEEYKEKKEEKKEELKRKLFEKLTGD